MKLKYTKEEFPFLLVCDLKDRILSDSNLTDMEKLENIFELDKENIRKNDVRLFYAILGVLDANKKSRPISNEYFEGEMTYV